MKNVFSAIAALVLSILLAVSTVVIFLHYLAMLVDVPTIGNWDGAWLTDFLASNYPFLLSGIFIALVFVLLLFINLNKVRKFFMFSGIAFILNCIYNCILLFADLKIIKMCPGEIQVVLVSATAAFSDFLLLSSLVLILLAAVAFSVFASIVAAKGGKHEKDT